MTGNRKQASDRLTNSIPSKDRYRLSHHLRAWFDGFCQRRRFENLKTFVLFVGFPRSGHTLVGAHMTAHKNMVISNEVHSLRYLQMGYSRDQLMALILGKDRDFLRSDCTDGKYSYTIPNQWQGHHEDLKVIGDKKGGGTSRALLRNPELLNELRSRVELPVRIVHVVRNPFDTISRMQIVAGKELSWAIKRYFRMCRGAQSVYESNPGDVLVLRHEEYVASPKQQLARICRFVGVDASEDYLNACAASVNHSTRQSRRDVDWTPSLIEQVNQSMKRYKFLENYHFDESPIKRVA